MAESDEIRARVAALIGNHTVSGPGHWSRPASGAQVLGAATVDEIAATVHDDVVAPLRVERDQAAGMAEDTHHRAERAERQLDTARAALAAIRDRHRRHGDRCASCERHRHHEPRLAGVCDDPECRAGGEQHPCPDRTTAERGLGESEETNGM